MKKSLQQIADYYFSLGYRGEKLRKAFLKDEEYQAILKEKKAKITEQLDVSAQDLKKYILPTDEDYVILGKCKKLEKMELSKSDKELVKLIKSQLEDEWRKPLINKLDEILKRYK